MPEITEILSINRRELLLICLINYRRLIVCHRRIWIIRLNPSWYFGAWPEKKVSADEWVTPRCDRLMSSDPFCKWTLLLCLTNVLCCKTESGAFLFLFWAVIRLKVLCDYCYQVNWGALGPAVWKLKVPPGAGEEVKRTWKEKKRRRIKRCTTTGSLSKCTYL